MLGNIMKKLSFKVSRNDSAKNKKIIYERWLLMKF